jgi:hypothetical protein
MTTRTSTTRAYVRDLTMWLQLRDVDGVRIGQIVAEVESHVAESGEPAEVAFGPARSYAKQFGRSRDRWRVSPATVATTVAAAGGGWLLAQGFFHLLIGQPYAGVPAWVVTLGGAVVLLAVFLVVPNNMVIDPRRTARPGHARATLLASVGVMMAVLLGLLWLLSLFVG